MCPCLRILIKEHYQLSQVNSNRSSNINYIPKIQITIPYMSIRPFGHLSIPKESVPISPFIKKIAAFLDHRTSDYTGIRSIQYTTGTECFICMTWDHNRKEVLHHRGFSLLSTTNSGTKSSSSGSLLGIPVTKTFVSSVTVYGINESAQEYFAIISCYFPLFPGIVLFNALDCRTALAK